MRLATSEPNIHILNRQSKTLHNVILPTGVRFHCWVVEGSTRDVKVGYEFYPKDKSNPILSGELICNLPEILTLERTILNMAGVVLYANWDYSPLCPTTPGIVEYTDRQMNWLSSAEMLPLLDLLEYFEEESFDGLSDEDRGYYWSEGNIYDFNTHKKLITNINLN